MNDDQLYINEACDSTSDMGSQNHCGRVGTGNQPPSTPQTTPTLKHTQKVSKSFLLFYSMTLDQRTYGRTNGRTDKASYRFACPQLNIK